MCTVRRDKERDGDAEGDNQLGTAESGVGTGMHSRVSNLPIYPCPHPCVRVTVVTVLRPVRT